MFFAVSVRNHKDIVESDNNNYVKITDNYEKLVHKLIFIAKSMNILGIVFLYFRHNIGYGRPKIFDSTITDHKLKPLRGF